MNTEQPGTHRIRLKDIAMEMGISISVVSKALHNTKSGTAVSEEKREKIRACAERMGYRPDHRARTLVNQRSMTIGLVARSDFFTHLHTNAYFSKIISEVMDAVKEKGYLLSLLNVDYENGDYEGVLDLCRSQRVDGLLISPPDIPPTMVQALSKLKIPHVGYFGKEHQHSPVNQVMPRVDYDVTTMAGETLIKLGHRNIAYFHTAIPKDITHERHKGFEAIKNSCSEVVLHTHAVTWHIHDPISIQLAIESARTFLTQGEKNSETQLTAIICDERAHADIAMHAARQAGRSVPEDISIISLGDEGGAGISEFSYSRVVWSGRPGYEAAHQLFQLLDTGQEQPIVYQEPEYIDGGSCTAVKLN